MKRYVAEFIGAFWLAPIAGGVPGALIYNFIGSEDES
jgi:glycerol uptake facilitator-like aquaporin